MMLLYEANFCKSELSIAFIMPRAISFLTHGGLEKAPTLCILLELGVGMR